MRLCAALGAVAVIASMLGSVAVPISVGAAVGNPVVTLGGVPGSTGHVVQTGSEVFDGLGECSGAAPLAPPVAYPGNDCGPGDNVVRTNDVVSYGYSLGVSNLDGPSDPAGAEFVDDVHFTQTITPGSPDAIVAFASMPSACRTGTNPDTGNPYVPQSSIVTDGSGSSTLTCNVGRLDGPSQTIFLQTQVRVDSDSKNNADFTASDTICETDGGCTPVSTRPEVTGVDLVDATADNTAYVSAAPRFDLAKNKYGPNDAGVITHPSTGELGFLYRFYETIEVDAASDGKGSSPLDGDLTFSDMMYVQGTTTQVPLFEMHPTSTNDCRWNDHASRPVPFGDGSLGPVGTNVIATGDVTCTQSAPGAPIDFTLSGTDTSGDRFPTKGSNNSTSLQPPYYVASLYNYVWVPFEVIDRYDPAAACDAADTAAGFAAPFCGEVDTVGDLPVTNCVYDFDPNATDALGNPVSNYGADLEPGIYGAGTGLNNCQNTSFILRNRGGAVKYFHSEVISSGYVGGVLPGQTAYHTGDGPIEPGQTFATAARQYNNGTFPANDAKLCERIDNMTGTLIPIVSDAAWVPVDGSGRKQPAFARTTGQTTPASDIIVEYSSGPAGTPATGAVSWNSDHLVGGRSSLSGLYDQSDAEGQRLADCEDASGNWTTDPYSFDADEQASLQKIRSVRVSLAPGVTLDPGSDLRLALEMEMRNTFNGGPNDGELIPAGVIVPNFIDYRSDELNAGNWQTTNYNQNTDVNSLGDRLITSRGFVRIAKHLVPYDTPWGDVDPSSYLSTGTGLSGDSFQFRLLPSVRSNLATGAADMTDVTVTDVLPATLSYDAVCTAGVSAYPPPTVALDSPTPGETTLTWNLGTVTPNGDLDPIDFCVESDPLAPDGTSAVNRVSISSNEDASSDVQRSASATVVLSQVGEFRVIKSVDSGLDPVDNNQIYTLEWLNSSDFVSLDPNIVIDVFPHGDDEAGEGSGAPRNPGSDYAGTLSLVGEPVSTEPGTFFYSKRAAIEVSYQPTASTNPHAAAPHDATNPNLGPLADADDDGEADSGRTIWCLESDFGVSGCPDDFADATAVMFVGSSDIDPGERDSIAIELQAAGNSAGDLYANRYATFTPSLPGQVNESNTVIVRTAGMVLGDLVWLDSDNDGVYEPGRGEQTVPDGVVVELLDGSLNPTGDTTTTTDGRYLFEGLESGQYAVRIPASQFASGGPLEGLRAGTSAGDPADPDNEGVDQNGIAGPGGSVITDVIDLSFATVPDAAGNIDIAGDEPLGDDVAALRVDLDDSLTNMTLDIGLVGEPAISIVTRVQGDDANTSPGVIVAPGDPVTWTYTVTNTGTVDLTSVTVTDDQGLTLSCADHLGDSDGDHVIDLLLPGETVVCTATGTATLGQHINVGDVIGDSGSGTTVTDDDPANHFGAAARIDIETDTNGEQADTGNGPLIAEGGPITWTYVVTNTGNVTLDDVMVTDDQLDAADISCADHLGDTDGDNVIDSLAPGQSVTCTATGTADSGQYENTGAATGTPEFAALADVADTDPTHHWGTEAAIGIETATNGIDADTGPGPMLPIGDSATWTYVVTNDGNLPLLDVTVGDSDLTAGNLTCADHLGDADGDNVIALLLPGESVTCTASGPVVAGQYANTGSVSGTPAFPTADGTYDPAVVGSWPTSVGAYTVTGDADVDDTDPTHHFGLGNALLIEKATNGTDADVPVGPWMLEDDEVTWTYRVVNGSNTALRDVAVTDDIVSAADISCPAHLGDTDGDNVIELMLPGDTIECSATGLALPGQYANIGDATGQPVYPTSPTVGFDPDDAATYPTDPADYSAVIDPGTGSAITPLDDQDPSHYFGTTASIDIEKLVEGEDADVAPGPNLDNGSTATWTFTVTNTGDAPLIDVVVSDDDVDVTVLCPSGWNTIDLLLPGETVECTAAAEVVAGSYVNVGEVEGQPAFPTAGVGGAPLDPADPSTWSTDPSDYDPIVVPGTGEPVASAVDTDEAHHFGNGPAIELVEEVCLLADQSECDQTVDDHWGPERVHLSGDTEQWRYTITNIGNVDLTNVVFTEPGLTECSATIGDLAVGEVRVIRCAGQGPIPFATTSTVSGEGPTGREVTDDSVATLSPPPELIVDKVVSDTTLSRDEQARYTLTVHNLGLGTATGVILTDPLPAGIRFVEVVTADVETTFESGTLRWSIGTLEPGESATMTFVAAVTASNGSVINTASALANELEAPATLADNADSAGFVVVAGTSQTQSTTGSGTGSTPNTLAFTGGNAGFMAGLAGLLLEFGAVMAFFGRRRERAAA